MVSTETNIQQATVLNLGQFVDVWHLDSTGYTRFRVDYDYRTGKPKFVPVEDVKVGTKLSTDRFSKRATL
jgi:hypothetical protein